MTANPITLEVEMDESTGVRRYRWRLTSEGVGELLSPSSSATRREALMEGQTQLDRARARGGIRQHPGRWAPEKRAAKTAL